MNNTIRLLSLLIITTFLLSSCVWMPLRMSTSERRLWIHQNKIKSYYYKTHPTNKERARMRKKYTPYFRPGRY
jgi:hypothetical protein